MTQREAFTLIMDREEDEFLAKCKNFDISWKDNNGNNLLTQSIRYNLPKVFQCLLDMNVNIDTPNGYGTTPTMWTLKENQYEMFATLLDKHANLSAINVDGDTAAKIFLDCKNKQIIEQFILSLENRQSLSLLESHILQTEHHFKEYTVGVIGIAKLQMKLNNSLSDKSTKENKRKL